MSLLICDKFLAAYEAMVTPDATQVKRQQAIAVRLIHRAVCFHTTTTYTDTGAPIEDPLGLVVDLSVKVTSTPTFFPAACGGLRQR